MLSMFNHVSFENELVYSFEGQELTQPGCSVPVIESSGHRKDDRKPDYPITQLTQ